MSAKRQDETVPAPLLRAADSEPSGERALVTQEEVYQYEKTNPKSVFALALGAGIAAVMITGTLHSALTWSIEAELVPPPPALQPFTEGAR